MPKLIEQLELPYTPQQVFDLISDIESYPIFLPQFASARITERRGNVWLVSQLVKVNLLRLRFTTRAVVEPPARLHIVSTDLPFGTFSQDWSFAETKSGGTRLGCRTEFEFRSPLLRLTFGTASGALLGSTMNAFARRARQLYAVGLTAPVRPAAVPAIPLR